MTWAQLSHFPNYEICDVYDDNNHTYPIRRKSSGRIIKTNVHHSGYVQLHLDGTKTYFVHNIIAHHFIMNDDETKTEIDHKDRDRTNNRIENLRYVTKSENMRNRTKYTYGEATYFNELPDGAVKINTYGKHNFDDLYYHNDKFYFWNGNQYRVVHTFFQNDTDCIRVPSSSGKKAFITVKNLKRLYHLN